VTRRLVTLLLAAVLLGCSPPIAPTDGAVLAPPSSGHVSGQSVQLPSIVPEANKPFLTAPSLTPTLSTSGYGLIIEFEVGGRSGYNPRPEAPDARSSGVTWGIGYDAHQNTKIVILDDWKALGLNTAARLAETQPYYGRSAQQHLHEVRDILVSWGAANDVFLRLDVAREYSHCRKVYSKFDELRPNAQAVLISLGFNRGYSMVGDNRRESRAIRDLVPKKDYAGMAAQLRVMVRVWRGTEIERGMTRRRLAEAKLMETP
jgi:hypothetical protein